MKYLVIYEKSESGWGAYVPDLPGLGAAGSTLEEVKQPKGAVVPNRAAAAGD